jgi:hypothetical protein
VGKCGEDERMKREYKYVCERKEGKEEEKK